MFLCIHSTTPLECLTESTVFTLENNFSTCFSLVPAPFPGFAFPRVTNDLIAKLVPFIPHSVTSLEHFKLLPTFHF